MQKRSKLLLLATSALLLVAPILQGLLFSSASAAQITARSLTLQAGATDGGSKPSGTVKHFFQFSLPTTGNVGSIKFLYCTLAAGTCNTPTGLTTASITGPQAVSYQLSNIVNPSGADCYGGTPPPSLNCTFFVRISTYATTDTSGSLTDSGVVTASIAQEITLTGTMPESLVFCTGGSVSTTASVPDCGTATSGAISFNQLFSPTDTATVTSQMAASTNAGSGYAITINGVTLTSGGNTVTAMTTNANGDLGVRGIGQFGTNLKANTTTTSNPAIGTEVAPAANGTNYKGQATTGYNTVDRFRFVTGETVANSASGGAGGTDAQIFTNSYVVNVPGSQPAGTYTTTLTYICTPTF
jgi:hypothetical protein